MDLITYLNVSIHFCFKKPDFPGYVGKDEKDIYLVHRYIKILQYILGKNFYANFN